MLTETTYPRDYLVVDNMLHNTTKSAGIILAVSKTSMVFQLCEVGGLSGFKPSLSYPVCLWH